MLPWLFSSSRHKFNPLLAHCTRSVEMDLFAAVDSFFTTIDSLTLSTTSETVSGEHQDLPVDFDGGGTGSGCIVA